ncbi:MAG: alpha/beta hydrolase [Bacteroidota bacterium]
MKKVLYILGVLILIALGGFLVGPKPEAPTIDTRLPQVPQTGQALDAWLQSRENQVAYLKPDNEARIVWADSTHNPTPVALVYLHGFSASQEEGAAMARAFAERYGMNLLLTRLYAHGLEEPEPLLRYNADSVYNTALEALAMGKVIGKKVLLMSTSTGGTLSLKLSAEFPEIMGNILYSPNIALADPSSPLLIQPWGLQIARTVLGSDYRAWEGSSYEEKYWNTKYRVEAIVELQNLMSAVMTEETFSQVKQPTLLCMYYKDEEHQDGTVSVAAMREMFKQLGTPENQKEVKTFPDAEAHVIANPKTSKSYEEIKAATFEFAEQTLSLDPVPSSILPARTNGVNGN